MFDRHTLIWEYPRQTPDGDQVDLVEVMELDEARISHHRIYAGMVRRAAVLAGDLCRRIGRGSPSTSTSRFAWRYVRPTR